MHLKVVDLVNFDLIDSQKFLKNRKRMHPSAKVLFVMKKVLDVMKICLKSWKSPKCYCFGKLNLTNLPIHQKYTRNTKLVLPKIFLHDFEQHLFFVLFCMKKCFLLWKGCLMSWKFPWSHESLQNAIVLLKWTWLTVLER